MAEGRGAGSNAVRDDWDRGARQAPVQEATAGRVAGLDVARGLAVLGMFGAHLGVGGELTWTPSGWFGVMNGRPSILFAVLAGVSIAILSGRDRPVAGEALVRARLRIFVRAAWVFVIGGLLELLDTDVYVILGVYAVLFVLALPFLRWPPARLFGLAGALAVAGPLLDLLFGELATANDDTGLPFDYLMFTGPYPAVIWWAFVLVGLAVGRLDLRSGRTRVALTAIGAGLAVAGYAAGWVSTQVLAGGRPAPGLASGFEQLGSWDPAWLSGAEPHSGTPFEVFGSTGVALAVIGACLVLADRLPRLTYPVGAVGSMALSVYTAHLVAIWVLGSTGVDAVALLVAFTAVAVLGASGWRLVLGRGPLERLLGWSAGRAAPAPGGGSGSSDRPVAGAPRGAGETSP